MKNKIIIAITIIAISLAGYLFGRQWINKADQSEIQTFLESFAYKLENKPADSVAVIFDVKQRKKEILRIVDLLAGRTAVNGKSKAFFKPMIAFDDSEISVISDNLSEVKIPATFTYEGLPDFKSSVNITLQKRGKNNFRIIAFNAEDIFTDFVAFENAIRSSIHPDKDIYSPVTLNAFKGAEQLKGKYDTVVWFSYIDNKPFYYVANGEWDFSSAVSDYKDDKEPKAYQMGLLDSEFKEIIPAQYDLISNIGGTYDGLIEVEKEGKRGFYNLAGENIIPVEFDQIIPLLDEEKAGVLSKGSDYFWLNKDYSISEKDSSIRIADILHKVYSYKNTFNLSEADVKHLIEFNSKEDHSALYLPPSYMADWHIVNRYVQFANPLRKNVEFYDISSSVEVKYSQNTETTSWLEAAISSIRDNYIGGRSDFYENKHVMMIDRRSNKVYGFSFPDDQFSANLRCNTFSMKAVSDTLIEIKTSAYTEVEIGKKFIDEMPSFHYVSINDGKSTQLNSKRLFSFTEYVKLDNSYLSGCYVFDGKPISKLNKDMLTYMKMEIYANYNYVFPEAEWIETFKNQFAGYEPLRTDVDSYLTETDRYNISFLDKKIREISGDKKLASLK